MSNNKELSPKDQERLRHALEVNKILRDATIVARYAKEKPPYIS